MTLGDYQRALRDVCFAREARASDLAILGGEAGGEAWRWTRYRAMVRARLVRTIDHCFERTLEQCGEARFHALVERFFAEAPPRSPYLRDVPGELVRYLQAKRGNLLEGPSVEEGRDAPLAAPPAYLLDLARYEWAELETAYLPDAASPEQVAPFAMDLPPVLSPAHRVLRFGYPVHLVMDTIAPAPTALCLYREPRTHEVETIELTPLHAALLEAMAEPLAALTETVRRVAAREGIEVGASFVDDLGTLLADLLERGVLRGSLATT